MNKKKNVLKIHFWDSTIPDLRRIDEKAESWYVPQLFQFATDKVRCQKPYRLKGKERCYELLHAICSEIFGTYYQTFGQDGFLNTRSKANKSGPVSPSSLLLAFSSKYALIPLPVNMTIKVKDVRGFKLAKKQIKFHPGKGYFMYQMMNMDKNRGLHSALPFFEGMPSQKKSKQVELMKKEWNTKSFHINPKDFPGLSPIRKQYPYLNSIYFLCKALIKQNGQLHQGDLRFSHVLAFQDNHYMTLIELSFCSIREDDYEFADNMEDSDIVLRIQQLNFVIDGYTLIYHGGLSEAPNFLK